MRDMVPFLISYHIYIELEPKCTLTSQLVINQYPCTMTHVNIVHKGTTCRTCNGDDLDLRKSLLLDLQNGSVKRITKIQKVPYSISIAVMTNSKYKNA